MNRNALYGKFFLCDASTLVLPIVVYNGRYYFLKADCTIYVNEITNSCSEFPVG
jgi:hypothetical protein